ncbi:MAG: hypothetical protein H6667_14925 [Ardenticatenaceae bacterium]|nr:hypothetical protein [Ardenticatenaceae bacterium]MCB9444569.1 hypothetical protein [Ardenticatenaceae bacterium]
MADNLSVILTETITPWLLGTLILLATLTLAITIKSWREMKRSPYFFMRRQAEKRLQTYASASFFLAIFAAAVAFYSWQPPTDSINRVALLTNAKPPKEEIIQIFEDAQPVARLETADIEELVAANTPQVVETAIRSVEPTLPNEYNQVEPLVALKDNTTLGTIDFSTEISDQYEALNSRKLFAEGFYTLYATFSYEEMADGMAWSWLWRHNGEVVEGANELWQYGDDGPGYIYFNPDEGFQFGDYSLEVWVNGELLAQSTATMNSAAAAAGN